MFRKSQRVAGDLLGADLERMVIALLHLATLTVANGVLARLALRI